MAINPEMLKVLGLKQPPGAIPNGMKITALQGPDVLTSAPLFPALAIGSFTLVPFSYMDNRVSYGMVMYDPKGNVCCRTEKAGARYIYKATIDGTDANATVSFWGQSDQKVTLSMTDLLTLMEKM